MVIGTKCVSSVVNTTLRNITFMVLLTGVILLTNLHVRRWVDKRRVGYVDYRNCPLCVSGVSRQRYRLMLLRGSLTVLYL